MRRTTEVVGEAAGGHQAIDQAAALSPDVVVMEISMPGKAGSTLLTVTP